MTAQGASTFRCRSRLDTVLIGSSLEMDSNSVVRTGAAVARAAGAKVYLVCLSTCRRSRLMPSAVACTSSARSRTRRRPSLGEAIAEAVVAQTAPAWHLEHIAAPGVGAGQP